MSLAPKFVYLPPADDDGILMKLGPEFLKVADRIIKELNDSTSFNRRKAFTKQAYTELKEGGTAEAGTRWPLAHLFEYGSAKTQAESPLRNAAEVVAAEVGRLEL